MPIKANKTEPSLPEIIAMRQEITKNLSIIKNRLTFGFSKPLQQQYMELLKQDVSLICKINDYLISIQKR